MNRTAAGGSIVSIGVVVRRIAVEETVGHDLVNTLRLPEAVGNGLGTGRLPPAARDDEANDTGLLKQALFGFLFHLKSSSVRDVPQADGRDVDEVVGVFSAARPRSVALVLSQVTHVARILVLKNANRILLAGFQLGAHDG